MTLPRAARTRKGSAGSTPARGTRLTLYPCTRDEANVFVDGHHRHSDRVGGHLFALSAAIGDRVVGVAIVGRPKARMLQDGLTAEVVRLTTDGTRNACSFLYGAAWRVARAMGFRKLITYTLRTEPGVSLRASGWRVVGEVDAESWDRDERPRVDTRPLQEKLRWEIAS
jgi:hypothetical protein